MRLLRHFDEIYKEAKGGVVALGNFDGFHRGHQVVIGEAGRIARREGVPLVVVVTEPHPVEYFSRMKEPFRLTPFRERAQILEAFGVDMLLVLPFDKDLASTEAEVFIDKILIQALEAKHIVVGYDYRFGRARRGDIELLASIGKETASRKSMNKNSTNINSGFGLTVVDAVTVGIDGFAGEVYSSTLVREALKSGRPRRAAALLGHWWTISGRVVEGDRRGRTIGFPTANIELGGRIEPKRGVYAVRVLIEETDIVYEGVANFGARPTFDKSDLLLEVHLFDFDMDIYDCHLDVELVCFLRDEQKFSGLGALKEQIAKDCKTANTVLDDPENCRNYLNLPSLDEYLRRYPVAHQGLRFYKPNQ